MKILLTREIPQSGIEALKKEFGESLIIHHGPPMTSDQLKESAKGCDGVLSLLTDKITPDVMDAAGDSLRIISNYAVGFDNVDLTAATERRIIVTNTPGVLTEAVAEHTVALLIAVSRRIVEADKFMRTGKYKYWEPMLFLGPKIYGKTLGIVGLGRIGHHTAKILKNGFDMKVLYYDVRRDDDFEREIKAMYVSLDDLLEKSDFVSIHVPLLPSTHHLMSEREFKKMKPTAILVNTSRGPVIDENALVRALKEKWIEGAGIDVFEFEPNLAEGLAELDNIIVTPHIASATREARIEMARLASQSVVDVLVNKKIPENIVNKEVKPRF
ncbi:D-glycerate dehydrogenase [candidate division WWE3 bacterium RIFCSPHIGHO2_01_FULL_40_23]|uniref:D-glycerate dehydrogenase n=1 Tax=candidate division WWE3 bacterium RIFCSPLOWO2_01_FULL_41_18 TaxID=1802625 RepID=A0A1F4VGD2_UNCKA|nr:MAG: D-glycerate dehydrogenase [candidate division WWE3 bacterium RIFCSPHIGHO2_01_FULL_40_23]OGC55763.1 MAG: D-glycerate dehydrogenase [candidate division WWE3 bacterium RIFCSPLOWO2_01_FULL_41_18]